MDERKIKQIFWVEPIHATVVILIKAHFIPYRDKTPYEIWYGRSTTIKHFKVFGSICCIKRNDENIGEFIARVDEDIFLGFSKNRKGYRCHNKNTKRIFDYIDVKFDEHIDFEDN